jgi:hypothetical protein
MHYNLQILYDRMLLSASDAKSCHDSYKIFFSGILLFSICNDHFAQPANSTKFCGFIALYAHSSNPQDLGPTAPNIFTVTTYSWGWKGLDSALSISFSHFSKENV